MRFGQKGVGARIRAQHRGSQDNAVERGGDQAEQLHHLFQPRQVDDDHIQASSTLTLVMTTGTKEMSSPRPMPSKNFSGLSAWRRCSAGLKPSGKICTHRAENA